jgi:hypothetical protein
MREEELVTGGYLFSTSKDYSDASQEQESVNILRAKADLSNPRTALKVYNKLTENRTFKTVVGLAFLKELQNTILNSGIAKEEDLDVIYIPAGIKSDEVNVQKLEEYKLLSEKQKARITKSRIINVFLVLTILAMIIIAVYTDKTMYAEFENKVIDHYSSWENELNNREEALLKREEALKQPNNG